MRIACHRQVVQDIGQSSEGGVAAEEKGTDVESGSASSPQVGELSPLIAIHC